VKGKGGYERYHPLSSLGLHICIGRKWRGESGGGREKRLGLNGGILSLRKYSRKWTMLPYAFLVSTTLSLTDTLDHSISHVRSYNELILYTMQTSIQTPVS
jgi:hypothetical protein